MKLEYIEPQIEIQVLAVEDIVAVSGDGEFGSGDGWTS